MLQEPSFTKFGLKRSQGKQGIKRAISLASRSGFDLSFAQEDQEIGDRLKKDLERRKREEAKTAAAAVTTAGRCLHTNHIIPNPHTRGLAKQQKPMEAPRPKPKCHTFTRTTRRREMYESTASTLLPTPSLTSSSNVQNAYEQMEPDHQDEDGVDFSTDM